MPNSPLQTSHLIISHSLQFQSFTKPKVCATMSCNGCRVLRKACGIDCVLRPCLDWIESPDAQAHATLFLSKFFGRSDLVNYISSVPSDQRSEIFRSLLYEAAGRTANPINGAMGLLSTGNWHLCEAAVQTVLSGGSPIAEGEWNIPEVDESSDSFQSRAEWGMMIIRNQADGNDQNLPFMPAADVAVDSWQRNDGEEPKLLNLFE